ncbi:hypothetical protein F5Y01DRAFT_78198 [Xylaria sp. FL0043]|nr:hypothetical protein F5Y01DRAFT_78198 [Xylaria sp. FL0043]
MGAMLVASLEILLILGVQAASAIPPAGHDTPLCSARSEAPSMFSISNIAYSMQNPPTTAHLRLDVTNLATNYTTICNLEGPQLIPGLDPDSVPVENLWTPCENRTVVPGEARYYTVDTDVLFERNSKLLIVNQTWYCDDVNPAYPIAFKGTAKTRLVTLNCTNSTSSQMTEECTAPDMSVSIYQYWRDDLPPNALENPIPTTSPVP